MKRLKNIFLIVFCFASLGMEAQKASVALQVPQAVVEGKKFNVAIRVSNAQQVDNPPTPELNNCTLIYGPVQQQRQSYQVVNGVATSSSSIDFNFTFKADKAGTVNIPALTITVDGKSMTTNSAKLTILPPDSSAPSAGAGGNRSGAQQSQPGEAAKVSPDDMFIRIILNKSQVYEQEAVVATMKIYSRYSISSFRTISQPTFDGFFSEEINVPTNVDYENYNGKNYSTCVLRKVVLYPQKAGKLTVSSGEFELTVVQQQAVNLGFFTDYRPVEVPVTAKTNSASITVLPLPEPKPAGFSGAVGSFTATAEMKPLELRANEVTQYIYEIKGTGNVKFLTAPSLVLPPGVDKLTPKTDINASFTGSDMKGTFEVNFSLIPQNPGKLEIPSQKFIYFDLSSKEYRTIDLPSFELHVAKGANTSSSVEQTTIAKGMTDILHIKPITQPLSKQQHYVFRTGGYWLLYLLCAVALTVIMFAYRRQLRLNADVTGRKMARANKQAAKRLKAAKAFMNKHDSENFYIELNKAMAGYISDKLNIPVSGLVRDNIASQLAAYGAPQDAIDSAINVLDECEMARFASTNSDAEMSALLAQAEAAIKAIEKSS